MERVIVKAEDKFLPCVLKSGQSAIIHTKVFPDRFQREVQGFGQKSPQSSAVRNDQNTLPPRFPQGGKNSSDTTPDLVRRFRIRDFHGERMRRPMRIIFAALSQRRDALSFPIAKADFAQILHDMKVASPTACGNRSRRHGSLQRADINFLGSPFGDPLRSHCRLLHAQLIQGNVHAPLKAHLRVPVSLAVAQQ
ncbi:MAG: hypothetical protein MR616_02900 [Pyramidobacter sp.]|nr:hypothetical protein [Pyramidobacter sp.]